MARVALVTGGTRGIGASISKALKAAGYKVAATYAGNDTAAEKFKADTGIPVASVEALKAALAENKKTAEFKIYPGAPHGFHADYRASYRKEAADDAWAQMQAWFKKYGVLS